MLLKVSVYGWQSGVVFWFERHSVVVVLLFSFVCKAVRFVSKCFDSDFCLFCVKIKIFCSACKEYSELLDLLFCLVCFGFLSVLVCLSKSGVVLRRSFGLGCYVLLCF